MVGSRFYFSLLRSFPTEFLEGLIWVFDHPIHQDEAATNIIISLHQSKQHVAEHPITFWVMMKETGWNNQALKGAFY